MMDIESIAKNVLMGSMTEEQRKVVLEGIKESVKQAKDVQKQRIGENVAVVVAALKKIEEDLRNRYDNLQQKVETRVNSIKDGKDGERGTDGHDGRDGKPGRDGQDGRPGRDGKDGAPGKDGKDGISVVNARLDFDNSLVIYLSDGREINVGEIMSPDMAEKIKIVSNGGGTSQSVLDTLTSLQNQINALVKGLAYQGNWNASTNTPTLSSGTGTQGYFYIVSVAGSTNLDGITDWGVNDWAVFNGTAWQKIDNSDLVVSVNGQTGAVTLTTTNISEGTNQYFTNTRARSALSAGTGISYDNSTGVITNSSPDQTVALTAGTGISTSGTYPNFTIANTAPDQTVSLTGSGTTTISGTYPNFTVSSADQYTGTVTSVTGTSPVASSGGNTPAISLASGYGDTQNPYASKTANFFLAAPNGSAGTPSFRAIVAADVPTLNQNTTGTASNVTGTVAVANGGTGLTTIAALSIPVANTANIYTTVTPAAGQSVRVNAGNTAWEAYTPSTGTVTSVSGTGTVSGLSLSGTVTTTGNITLGGTLSVTPSNFASQTANTFLAAPDGLAGTPTFRTIVAADVPTLNQNTTGTASNVTGTVAIANGGSGQTTAQAAMNAFAGAVTSGSYLRGNGTNVVMSTIQAADVPTLNQNTTGTASNVTGTVAIANGGTGATTAANARTNLGSTTLGSNLFTITNPSAITFPRFNADNTVSSLDASTFRTAIGAGIGNGTVTSVAQTFTGGLISVSGSPVTTSGTLALTVAGTSGGIPYFSSASTWASSSALTANAVMIGGGAGAAPSTITTGTSGQVLTSNGSGSAPSWQTVSSGSGFSNMDVLTAASGTWTSPAGVTKIKVTIVGSGGGGGAGTSGVNGTGGGAGGTCIKVLTVAASTGYSYVVGAGGSAGGSGNTSSFGPVSGTTYSATGGSAGTSASGTGGAGGVGSNGDLNITGGGGGGASTSNGTRVSGNGGSSFFGSGGFGAGSTGANQTVGNGGNYGGGGGGGCGNIAGGTGGAGVIVIEY